MTENCTFRKSIFLSDASELLYRNFAKATLQVSAALMVLSLCIVPGSAQCVSNGPTSPITIFDEVGSLPDSRMLTDGLGTTVDVSVPGKVKINTGSAMPLPRREGSWMPLSSSDTSFSAVGMSAVPSVSGTPTNNSSSSGNLIKYTTTTSLNAVGGIQSASLNDVRYQYSPKYSCRIRTSSAGVTNQRIWVGLVASAPSGSATPTANLASFRFDTGAGDTTWKAVVSNASTNTIVNSGITVATGTTYDLSIDMQDPTKVVFYINGASVASITTTLPVAATDLGPNVSITNLSAGTARDLSIGTTRLECY